MSHQSYYLILPKWWNCNSLLSLKYSGSFAFILHLYLEKIKNDASFTFVYLLLNSYHFLCIQQILEVLLSTPLAQQGLLGIGMDHQVASDQSMIPSTFKLVKLSTFLCLLPTWKRPQRYNTDNDLSCQGSNKQIGHNNDSHQGPKCSRFRYQYGQFGGVKSEIFNC